MTRQTEGKCNNQQSTGFLLLDIELARYYRFNDHGVDREVVGGSAFWWS